MASNVGTTADYGRAACKTPCNLAQLSVNMLLAARSAEPATGHERGRLAQLLVMMQGPMSAKRRRSSGGEISRVVWRD
ncbi:hypothetical protein BCR44DRAFT_34319 [Catenaria anguillulae PL171]|uniref:Uncharacterized protein n=1 Tax=Catenaria anguillulae PL171 TaxID=765915 RepID=A0A1Y2HKY8_9FUNG|nr:hypothetical protein BCR44DRAFT_34319 [Catenaria anguillulae PL171]